MGFRSLYNSVLTLVACCLLLTSCFVNHTDRWYDDDEADTRPAASVYLSLQINTGVEGTRANPNEEEGGDGTEDGIYNENKIEKLVFFFFDANQATGGVDHATEPDKIEVITEFCENPILINQTTTDASWNTRPIELKNITSGKTYYMVVVANAYFFQFDQIKTLKDLQNFIFSGDHWQSATDIKDYNRFIMTSRFKSVTEMDKAKVTVNHGNDYDNPATATAYLERLAARVDIIPTTGPTGNGAEYYTDAQGRGFYEFKVRPEVGTSNDKVRLYGIQLINKYNQGSYLLKHVAEAIGSGQVNEGDIDMNSITRIGIEKTDIPTKASTNYVVDPKSNEKKNGSKSPWYDDYYSDFNSWMPVIQMGVNMPYILSYTQENTINKSSNLDKLHYVTALNLRCVYVPNGANPGETFYTFQNVIYTSITRLVVKVNEYLDTVSQPHVDSTTVLQRPDVITYKDGECYFVYYIRHSEEGSDSEDRIMKYGIVRNNIYRITINSFKGLGSEDKNDLIPITKNVEFKIWVVPWNVIENPEIIL